MILAAGPDAPDFGMLPDLPGTALALDTVGGAAGDPLPVEAQALPPTAAAPRRAEFAAGRLLARRAMAALDLPAMAIPRGPEGDPVWPSGLTGSVTHGGGLVAAVVSRRLLAVGVDVERVGRMTQGVAELVLTGRERRDLAAEPLATAAFSAKEAAYKAVNPVVRRWIGFQEAEVELDLASGRFTVRHLGRDPANAMLDRLEGAVRVAGGCVLTLAWLRAAPPG